MLQTPDEGVGQRRLGQFAPCLAFSMQAAMPALKGRLFRRPGGRAIQVNLIAGDQAISRAQLPGDAAGGQQLFSQGVRLDAGHPLRQFLHRVQDLLIRPAGGPSV